MWEQSQLTDVTLAAEGKTFQAHRMLLSACSPYFRHLFINNPCKHPTVFLKDVPERHMALLLEYMYAGRIAVRHSELAEVLKTASSLKIRGLTTPTEPEGEKEDGEERGEREVPPLMMETETEQMDKFHHIETGSNHSAASVVSATSRKTEGRKSSKPKKLRLSGDSDVTSPRYPVSLQEKTRVSPVEETEDNIAQSDDEKELVIDQPVDFSNSKPDKEPKYSILGSYLKTGGKSKSGELEESLRRAGLGSGWMNSLSSLSAPRPASRDSRGYSKEDDEEVTEDSKEDYPQVSLTETMGMGDIAERLRTHFLANMPSQSYNWLTSNNSLLEKVKREKHPSGGIK